MPSALSTFINSLKIQGKDEDKILQALQMYYEKPELEKEEVFVVNIEQKI